VTVFSLAEYALRLARTRQRMETAGIEVLVVCDPANMQYLSGYEGWSFYTPQALIVPLDEEPPIWVGRAMDAPTATATTWLPAERIVPYEDRYVDWTSSPTGSRQRAGRGAGSGWSWMRTT
jgi:ectoine hydrolase